MPVLITPTTLSSFPSNRPVVQKPGPRFGAMLVPQIFRLLEQNPIVDTLAKDILGFNIPKLALSRTKQEFWDIAPLEFGNTTITVVSTLFLPALLRYPVKAMSNLKSMRPLLGDVTEKLTSQAKLARLGVSFGFMFMFAGAFWAMPFFRNWLTLKQQNTANFEALLGYKTKNAPVKNCEEEKQFQLYRMLGALGVGVGLGAASMAGFSWMAKNIKGKMLSKPLDFLFRQFALKGNSANQIPSDLATYIFWAFPAYAGWVHAARGAHERREQFIKGINSSIWFSLLTPFLRKTIFLPQFNKVVLLAGKKAFNAMPSYNAIEQLTKGSLQRKLKLLKGRQDMTSFGITICMLAFSPQLLNIYLTRKRLEAEKLAHLKRYQTLLNQPV